MNKYDFNMPSTRLPERGENGSKMGQKWFKYGAKMGTARIASNACFAIFCFYTSLLDTERQNKQKVQTANIFPNAKGQRLGQFA